MHVTQVTICVQISYIFFQLFWVGLAGCFNRFFTFAFTVLGFFPSTLSFIQMNAKASSVFQPRWVSVNLHLNLLTDGLSTKYCCFPSIMIKPFLFVLIYLMEVICFNCPLFSEIIGCLITVYTQFPSFPNYHSGVWVIWFYYSWSIRPSILWQNSFKCNSLDIFYYSILF